MVMRVSLEHTACLRRMSLDPQGDSMLQGAVRRPIPAVADSGAAPPVGGRVDAPSRAMEGDSGVTNPRDGREGATAAATARAAHGAASGAGASGWQGVFSGSPPSPRGGIISRVWETLSGSPKASDTAQLSTSPPSPGAWL